MAPVGSKELKDIKACTKSIAKTINVRDKRNTRKKVRAAVIKKNVDSKHKFAKRVLAKASREVKKYKKDIGVAANTLTTGQKLVTKDALDEAMDDVNHRVELLSVKMDARDANNKIRIEKLEHTTSTQLKKVTKSITDMKKSNDAKQDKMIEYLSQIAKK